MGESRITHFFFPVYDKTYTINGRLVGSGDQRVGLLERP